MFACLFHRSRSPVCQSGHSWTSVTYHTNTNSTGAVTRGARWLPLGNKINGHPTVTSHITMGVSRFGCKTKSAILALLDAQGRADLANRGRFHTFRSPRAYTLRANDGLAGRYTRSGAAADGSYERGRPGADAASVPDPDDRPSRGCPLTHARLSGCTKLYDLAPAWKMLELRLRP